MSVLVYVENWNGAFKKSSFEAVGYASAIAKTKGTDAIAICLGEVNGDELAQPQKLLLYQVSVLLMPPNLLVLLAKQQAV